MVCRTGQEGPAGPRRLTDEREQIDGLQVQSEKLRSHREGQVEGGTSSDSEVKVRVSHQTREEAKLIADKCV